MHAWSKEKCVPALTWSRPISSERAISRVNRIRVVAIAGGWVYHVHGRGVCHGELPVGVVPQFDEIVERATASGSPTLISGRSPGAERLESAATEISDGRDRYLPNGSVCLAHTKVMTCRK